MSYQNDKQKEEASRLADAEWFSDRMLALVQELKLVKEPTRAAYIKGCLNAAIRAHGRVVGGVSQPTDDYE